MCLYLAFDCALNEKEKKIDRALNEKKTLCQEKK
jgi:hypothetical protein